MKILPEDKFDFVKPFFENIRYNLLIDSILNKNTIGRVYVDDVNFPTFAMIWTYTDSIIIGGSITNGDDLLSTFEEELFPTFKTWKVPYLIVYYDTKNPDLKNEIINTFDEVTFSEMDRVYFEFDKPAYFPDIKNYNDIQVLKVDNDILKMKNINGIDDLNDWVRSFWKTKEDFFKYGSGYCAIKDKTFVSWCITVYSNDNERELGLYTVEEYRKKGYASFVTSSVINDLINRNLNPHWHCRLNNEPSLLLAKKIGFKNPHYYKTLKMIF